MRHEKSISVNFHDSIMLIWANVSINNEYYRNKRDSALYILAKISITIYNASLSAIITMKIINSWNC